MSLRNMFYTLDIFVLAIAIIMLSSCLGKSDDNPTPEPPAITTYSMWHDCGNDTSPQLTLLVSKGDDSRTIHATPNTKSDSPAWLISADGSLIVVADTLSAILNGEYVPQDNAPAWQGEVMRLADLLLIECK